VALDLLDSDAPCGVDPEHPGSSHGSARESWALCRRRAGPG
jgi:hypothetical protein